MARAHSSDKKRRRKKRREEIRAESGGVFHLPNLSNQLQRTNQVSQRAGFKSFAINAMWDTHGTPSDLFDLFFALRHKRPCSVLFLKSRWMFGWLMSEFGAVSWNTQL